MSEHYSEGCSQEAFLSSLKARRLSLPVSLGGPPSSFGTASRTSRESSEGRRHLQVTVRSSTTSGGLFVKKETESFEGSFQR